MDRAEYEQKLKELEQKNKEMENEIKMLKQEKIEDELSTPPHPRWKPELGEDYFYCSYSGSVYKILWTNCKLDNSMYNRGNVFRTEEETKFEAERLKVLTEMREWSGEWNDPWGMLYNGCQVEAISVGGKDVTYGELRFATKEDTQNCIKSVGEDRIKKYYFGITE